MIKNKRIPPLQFIELIQPHPKACTPTNMAYLIALTTGQQFSTVLDKLLRAPLVLTKLHSENKGISFSEISDVVNNHLFDLKVEVDLVEWEQQPHMDPPFIIEVKQLPMMRYLEDDQFRSIELAKQAGALVEYNDVWEYPGGHAITVVNEYPYEVEYFDSYLGRKVIISRELFIKALPDRGQLLRVNAQVEKHR